MYEQTYNEIHLMAIWNVTSTVTLGGQEKLDQPDQPAARPLGTRGISYAKSSFFSILSWVQGSGVSVDFMFRSAR